MATILVIDDDATYRALTMRALEKMGHDVETATNGAKALQHLAEHSVDLIITDIFMPDMDGLEFIQTAIELNEAPILAISGGGSRVSIDFLKHAGIFGAKATLQKPFSRGDLAKAVTTLLHSAAGDRDRKSPAAAPAAGTTDG